MFINATIAIYAAGNVASWLQTTVLTPRNDYPGTMSAVSFIMGDAETRGLVMEDVGVHYYRPDDQYDFFAATLYYPMHRLYGLHIALTEQGNRLARGQDETHPVVYLYCDGYGKEEFERGCITPFITQVAAVQAYG